VPDKGNWCTAGLCLAQPCVELCGVESRAPPPSEPLSPLSPRAQAISGSKLSLLAALQRDGPDGTHQEDSSIVKSVIRRCWTMCMSIVIYFLLVIFSCGTPQISCLLSIDCYYFYRLINYNSRRRASVCVHHIAFAALRIVISHCLTGDHISNALIIEVRERYGRLTDWGPFPIPKLQR
jgi:hypothetical protein